MSVATTESGGKRLSHVEYWLVTLAVMSASLIQFLDMTIANVALPHMQAALNTSHETITWVLTSFIIASAVAIPTSGWVAARFGTRLPFLLAITAFILTSMLCGIATNIGQMVGFRILQGISAAFIAPLAQAILLDITEPAKHTRALSIWGMTSMLGPILGPTLGGYLTDNLSWRWVFFINVPIGIPALFILWRLLPDTTQLARRFDVFGYLMLVLALVSLQLMLDQGQTLDWFDSGEILIEGLVALAAFWIFLVHTRHSRHPLFPVALVSHPRVLMAAAFGIVLSWVMLGLSSMLPVMMQHLYGYSVVQTGELMAPRGIGIFVTMMFIPHIIARLPLRVILTCGFGIIAITSYEMTQWSLEMPMWHIATNAFVQGLGMGMLMVPSNFIAFAAIPANLRTDCAAFLNLVRNVAGSIAISVLVVILTRSTQTAHAEMVGAMSDRLPALPHDLEARLGGASTMGSTIGTLANDLITRQATMVGYLNVFHLLFLLALAVIPLCLAVRGKAQQG